jgi:hypothetical protein
VLIENIGIFVQKGLILVFLVGVVKASRKITLKVASTQK